ncbi:hypothetical protein ICE90_03755 [Polynucleobacter sp. AP-RePozz3-80-G7]|nr:hypothetical protein [Polynucleobacter sp. AP-RePozz3-80-G7]
MSASSGAMAAACGLGTYSSNGQDTASGGCIPAPAGSYVNTIGSTAATLAEPGRYQPNPGQTSALLASPGYYVPFQGATQANIAQPGSYVASSGSSSSTLAPPGYFVANTGATSATAALPGTYVANSGASAATLAPPGYFVANAGATSATAAPIGSFVSIAGASAAVLASAGSYVASTGQASATQVSPGFYTYAPGASSQVPAGLMAGPLNSTIRANEASIRDATSMIDAEGDSTIKSTFYYQGGSVDQLGQSSGARQNISFWGLNLSGNIFGSKDEPAGVLANVTSANYSAGSDGSGNGLGLSIGLFKKLQIETAKFVGTLLFGNYNYNSTRQNLSQGTVSGTSSNVQSATGNTNVNTYGVNVMGSLPLAAAIPNLDGFLNVAVTNYAYKGMNESVSGSGSNPSAGLNTSSMNYVSMPTTLGLRYSLMDSSNKVSLGAISVGYKYDFGKSTTMNMSTQSSPSYQFGLPIALTNARATVIEISSANYELQKDLSLSAAISTEFSSAYSIYQGSLRLRKSF